MANEVRTAVVLCGGRGSRLGAVGRNIPKCLLEVGGDPILFHHLRAYQEAGVSDVFLVLAF